MRVTRLGPTKPILSLTGILSTSDIGPSGQVPTSNGSNSVAWGSNISDIFVNATTHVQGPFVNFADGSNTTITVDTVNGVASNTIRWHSTGGAGASFGSNSTDVSETTQVGASSNTARADHYHRGIETITASSSNTMQRGTWNLRPGSGIALSLTDTDGDGEFDTTTIVNTGAGGGGGSATADAVRNQIGNGEIVIPGLAASPDIRVAGTNDLEFDTTTIGGTALGAPTTINANTTFKSHLYIKKAAAAGFSLQGRYWTVPSTPFTMTAKVTDWTSTKAAFMRVAMGLAEATPGKTEGIYIDGAGANGASLVAVISSTSPTAGAAYVQAGATGADELRHAPLYFRVVVASSTDITWYFSYGGLIFRRVAAANRNPGFTIGSYFLSAHPEQATYDMEAAFDWVRFT
jgi:hypothetical protein